MTYVAGGRSRPTTTTLTTRCHSPTQNLGLGLGFGFRMASLSYSTTLYLSPSYAAKLPGLPNPRSVRLVCGAPFTLSLLSTPRLRSRYLAFLPKATYIAFSSIGCHTGSFTSNTPEKTPRQFRQILPISPTSGSATTADRMTLGRVACTNTSCIMAHVIATACAVPHRMTSLRPDATRDHFHPSSAIQGFIRSRA